MDEFFQHENQPCPPSLSVRGKLHLGSKSDLKACLECLSEPQTVVPTVTNVIHDGAFVVQMLSPGNAKTFKDYADQVFIPYTSGQFRNVSRLDLVWDRYKTDSLRATAREKQEKGARRRVVYSAPIPGNWHSILRLDLNKQDYSVFFQSN